jgi:hypothetical protein
MSDGMATLLVAGDAVAHRPSTQDTSLQFKFFTGSPQDLIPKSV